MGFKNIIYFTFSAILFVYIPRMHFGGRIVSDLCHISYAGGGSDVLSAVPFLAVTIYFGGGGPDFP